MIGITITPEQVRRIAYQEFRDSIEDIAGHIEPADQWTAATTERINHDLTLAIAALWRFNDAVERVQRCADRERQMTQDSSDGPDVALPAPGWGR